MKKIILIIAIFTSLVFAGNITPEEYQVEITKMELKRADGTYVTMYEGNGGYISLKNTTTAGASVAGLLAGWKSPYPNATYTHVRTTVNRTIKIKACKATNQCSNGSVHANSTAFAQADAAKATLTSAIIPTTISNEFEYALTNNIVIEEGVCSLNSLQINFDLTDVLTGTTTYGNGGNDNVIRLDAPTVKVVIN